MEKLSLDKFQLAPQIPASGKSFFNHLVSLTRSLSKSAPKNISYKSVENLKMVTTISRVYYDYLRRPSSSKESPLVRKAGVPWPGEVSDWNSLMWFGDLLPQKEARRHLEAAEQVGEAFLSMDSKLLPKMAKAYKIAFGEETT